MSVDPHAERNARVKIVHRETGEVREVDFPTMRDLLAGGAWRRQTVADLK
jgi:hypothetical protein